LAGHRIPIPDLPLRYLAKSTLGERNGAMLVVNDDDAYGLGIICAKIMIGAQEGGH
jgi:hypothetical protein